MEGAGGTASLRNAAAHWSLAGDKQLLDLLQNLHERIVTKCQEANSSLEEMVNTLDTASISLQNVNNRLMALSNSQFVESRVYEDDVDVTTRHPPVKESPKAPPEPTSELSKLRDSLRVLESYHEPVHILDSDSDSVSDEEEDRMVYKPKDLYASRPLPYVIGSQQWRSKWHAGLVAEDSDTESDTSKANPPSEQYSDSEPDAPDAHADKPHASQRTISTNSSIGSELTIPTVGKPADIAAELARRLGGNVQHIPEPEPVSQSPPAASAPTKVYRPQQPPAGTPSAGMYISSRNATIFSDEPPPLDAYQSDQSDQPYQSDSEDDVFAEIHRATSHRPAERIASGVVDQLFGNVSDVYGRRGGSEDDVDKGHEPLPSVKRPSRLFQEQHSDTFTDKAKSEQPSVNTDTSPEIPVKKPVGGISLFGSNQGAESIGAAILKRKQRKVSTSDDDFEEPPQVSKINDYRENNEARAETVHNSNEKIQKDIINDLFSKTNRAKQTIKQNEKIPAVKVEKPTIKKVDLFNDDLFDDIDDIFTNIKPPVKEAQESVKKSLFDDDDDDLFANVATSVTKIDSKPEPKSIFDSDDNLFTEENLDNVAKLKDSTKPKTTPGNVSSDGLFCEDNNHTKEVESVIEKKAEFKDSDIGNINKFVHDKNLIKNSNAKSIFDSESDDDMFSDSKYVNNDSPNLQTAKHNIDTKVQPNSTIDGETVRNNESGSISLDKNMEINEKYEVSRDDLLFKQIEEPLDNTTQDLKSQSKNNINIDKDQSKNINKKSDELEAENKVRGSDLEKNTTVYAEDQLLFSTKSNENRIYNKDTPGILGNAFVPKTHFRSPSLFDEDDNSEDIFSKSPGDIKTKEVDDKLNNSNSNQSSEFIVNVEISIDSKFVNIKQSDVDIDSNVSNNLIHSVDESRYLSDTKSDERGSPAIKKNNSELSEDISKNSKAVVITNPTSNTLSDSEAPSHGYNLDYSIPIAKESVHEESNENKTEYDNMPTDFIQNEPLFSDTRESISGEQDIFSDVFSDIPPEFERPKEPKKSKNINALFDDDSDDEALFFKKNEIVTDDKPDVSFTSQEDRLFHIFHDEPPAMDVDFTQKSKKTSETHSDIISSQTDFYEQSNVKSLFKKEIEKESTTLNQDSESERLVEEAKKPVGKLKPMNFNINVSTLLPGASPKKTKTHEQVDGQVISTKTIEDEESKGEEPKIVKSVSFEGDPESEVLDNTFSKERVKIQVKRRPSSRRARKEAVRKSGIDFGDDSADNSSSTNIARKDTNSAIVDENLTNTLKKDVFVDKEDIKDIDKPNTNISDHNDAVAGKQLKSNVELESKLFNNVDSSKYEHLKDNATSRSSLLGEEVSGNSNLTTAFNKKPNVKSKVVYILNDEDIFTDTKPDTNLSVDIQTEPENTKSIPKNKVLNIVDDDDELFKPSGSRGSGIVTQGIVYKDVNLKNSEIDRFDSNENIFNASRSKSVKNTDFNTKSSNNKDEIDKLEAKIDKLFVKTHSAKVKTSLFDDLSDEESELFGNKKSVKNPNVFESSDGISTIIKKERKLTKNDTKRSLFGDESDEDDLFGVRTNKKEPSQPLSKPKEVTSKPTEPVFEDPLSMLTQAEDM